MQSKYSTDTERRAILKAIYNKNNIETFSRFLFSAGLNSKYVLVHHGKRLHLISLGVRTIVRTSAASGGAGNSEQLKRSRFFFLSFIAFDLTRSASTIIAERETPRTPCTTRPYCSTRCSNELQTNCCEKTVRFFFF